MPCNITHSPTCVGGFAEFPPDGVVNSDTAVAMAAAVGVHLVRFSAVQCGSSAIRTFLGLFLAEEQIISLTPFVKMRIRVSEMCMIGRARSDRAPLGEGEPCCARARLRDFRDP